MQPTGTLSLAKRKQSRFQSPIANHMRTTKALLILNDRVQTQNRKSSHSQRDWPIRKVLQRKHEISRGFFRMLLVEDTLQGHLNQHTLLKVPSLSSAHRLLGLCFFVTSWTVAYQGPLFMILGWSSVRKIRKCFNNIRTPDTHAVFISCFSYFSKFISKPSLPHL